MMTDMSNFHEYKKLIQEQMTHENKFHDKHVPALVASTRVSKLNKVVDSGFLFFGDQNADDDDDAAADIATADDDETGFSCAASFSCGTGREHGTGCGHGKDVGSGGKLGSKRQPQQQHQRRKRQHSAAASASQAPACSRQQLASATATATATPTIDDSRNMHHPSGIGSVGRGCTGSCPAPERQGGRMDLDERQTLHTSHGQRPSSGCELPTQSVKAEGCSCSAGADPCCVCILSVFAHVCTCDCTCY